MPEVDQEGEMVITDASEAVVLDRDSAISHTTAQPGGAEDPLPEQITDLGVTRSKNSITIAEELQPTEYHGSDEKSDIENPSRGSPSVHGDTASTRSGHHWSQHDTYKNSLLPVVGFLDFFNAWDFPANVWQENPLPTFAKVLMGLGGSIAILSTTFAFWDLMRCRRNIRFLRQERAYLKSRRSSDRGLLPIEEAWLDINFRELGWEALDRMLLDVFMAIAGILVGTGCLLAIKGDIPSIFLASNVMSGYLGNSFNAAYGLVNAGWSFYMWRKAHTHDRAIAKAGKEIPGDVLDKLKRHSRRHKIYATVNGVTVLVSGVGSEISSTLWWGYVILIPCIIGSIFCNTFYWRLCLGYDRTSVRDRPDLMQPNADRILEKEISNGTEHEERFLAELYGYYLTRKDAIPVDKLYAG